MKPAEEWLASWAERWVQDAKEELRRHRETIARLKESLAVAAREERRELCNDLIGQHEKLIDAIRQAHGELRQRAALRGLIELPDLDEE